MATRFKRQQLALQDDIVSCDIGEIQDLESCAMLRVIAGRNLFVFN
jgi:hypothetical protein